MTSKNTWKALERKCAKALGGMRNPLSGTNSRHTAGDIIHPDYYVECKLRKKWAITSLFLEVKEHARKEQKIPLLVIKEKGKHGELVVMAMSDFIRLINAN